MQWDEEQQMLAEQKVKDNSSAPLSNEQAGVFLWICVCVCVLARVCCVCMYVCMYVCMCVCACMCACAYMTM